MMLKRDKDSTQARESLYPNHARVLIVVAPYYQEVTKFLMEGACAVLNRVKAQITSVEVSGALELPLAVALKTDHAERMKKPYDACIVLGCVVKGETDHYDFVCDTTIKTLQLLSLEKRLPLGTGILTVHSLDQAMQRAHPDYGDHGGHAAHAAYSNLLVKAG